MKLIPASSAQWMIRMLSSWSVSPQAPNIIAPRHSGLTRVPVRPRVRSSMRAGYRLGCERFRLRDNTGRPAPALAWRHRADDPRSHAGGARVPWRLWWADDPGRALEQRRHPGLVRGGRAAAVAGRRAGTQQGHLRPCLLARARRGRRPRGREALRRDAEPGGPRLVAAGAGAGAEDLDGAR